MMPAKALVRSIEPEALYGTTMLRSAVTGAAV